MATITKRRLIAGAGGSSSSSSSRTPVEDSDNVQSKSLASILDLLGEGKIGGLINGAKSIYLDSVPLVNPDDSSNFNGVSWWFRDGSQDQEVIEGFDAVETPVDVNVQIKTSTPRTIQIDNDDADQVRIIMMFPKLAETDRSTGDTHGTTVQYLFEIANGDNSFVGIAPQGYSSSTITLSKKSSSKHYREYIFDLPKPGSNYRMRVTRITADSTSDYVQNQTWLSQYGEIVNTTLNYPNSALVGIKIDAEQFGSTMPSRSYLVSGLLIRVPSNYDNSSNEYLGDWDGTFKLQVSSNPAWILYDILTSTRYGLGNFVSDSMVNIAQLYQIGRYCDELVSDMFGGKEKRFAINTVINSRGEAYNVLQDIVSTFRGMIFWAGGMVNIMQDSPASPVMQFSAANIIGKPSYKGTSRKDRATVALITYNDKDDLYKQNIEYVEDEDGIKRFGVRKTESVAFGCTSRGQAHRVGLWTLYSNRMETDLINFTSGLDSSLLMPGELVYLQDKFRAGRRNSGRLLSFTKNSIKLDATVNLTNVGNTISFLSAAGKMVRRDLIEGAGEYSTVTFSEALSDSEAPATMGIWTIIEPDLEPMIVRVLTVNQNDDKGSFDIIGVQHNPTKFAAIDEGVTLVPSNTTVLDPTFSTPEDLQVDEGTYLSSPGNLSVKLIVSWDGRSPSYVVRWRRSDVVTEWVTEEVKTEEMEILNVAENGTYDIEVYSISVTGRRSSVISTTYTTYGTTTAPDSPTELTAVGDYRVVVLNWVAPTALDLDKINVYASRTDDYENASLIASLSATSFTHSGLGDDETWYYWVRAVNKRGMVSPPNSSLGTVATTKDVLSFLKNKITSSELGEALLSEIDKTEIQETVDGLNKSVEDMKNSFTGMEEAQNELKESVQGTLDKVNDAIETVDGVAADVVSLQETVQEQNESVATTLDAAKAALDGTETLIAEERQARADGDTALGQRVDAMQSAVDSSEASIQEMQKTVASVEKSAAEWTSSLEANAKTSIDLALRQEEDKKQQTTTNASIKTNQKAIANSVEAMSQRVEEMKAEVGDDIAAKLREEQQVRASADEVMATQLTQLEVEMNENIKASLTTEQQARADADSALATQITNLQAQVNDDIKAQITEESKARVDQDSALASQISELSAQVNEDVAAQITSESTARADADTALGKRVDTVSARADGLSATIEETSKAVAEVGNKVSASWTLKMETTANGQNYAAGMALGIDGDGTSQFLIQADRFGLINAVDGVITTPFVIENSVAYMSGAYIKDGTITNAKIGDIQSTNYVAGVSGWRISKAGSFEMNGDGTTVGRTVRDNQRTDVYDDNNVLRVRIGKLS